MLGQYGGDPRSHSVCVCAPLCCKNLCSASRFCTGGRGAVGSRSKQAAQGAMKQTLGQGQGKKKTHKHKQMCGIVPGLDGWQNFVYVFFRVIPYGGEKHINKIPPKIPGQSREKLVYVFFLYVFFWKSKFLYRYRPEGIFRIFFGLILDPLPPGTYAFTAKKGKFICTGHFFPHGMAFLEKRGGLVPVYVFIFPVFLAPKGAQSEARWNFWSRLRSSIEIEDLTSSHRPPALLRQAPGAIPSLNQQLKKGVFGKGSFRNLCAELCLCVFLCSEVIFSCKSHSNFFQKLRLQCRQFSGKPPREKPQNAAADSRGADSSRFWPFLATIGRKQSKTSKNDQKSTPKSTLKSGVWLERGGGLWRSVAGICPKFARNSEFGWNLLAIR